jgi:hypothetical protein
MKKIILGILAIFMFSVFADAATLDQMSLQFYTRTNRGQSEWRWTPLVNFEVWGKYQRYDKFTVQITAPNGSELFKMTCKHTGDSLDEYATIDGCTNDADTDTNLTGVFGFKIIQTDNNATLYSGKFTVGKHLYNPAKNPAFNKNFYYYIDYDWRLPMVYVGKWDEPNNPTQLFCWMWIKGDFNGQDPKAHLFYQGKKIAEASYGEDQSYSAEENPARNFSKMRFRFEAMIKPTEQSGRGMWWKLYENPGEYEIKLMRNGEITRSVKFNIDKGLPVQNGVGKEVKNIYGGIIVQSQISGTADGAINQTILKSGWWSNPISNLIVP